MERLWGRTAPQRKSRRRSRRTVNSRRTLLTSFSPSKSSKSEPSPFSCTCSCLLVDSFSLLLAQGNVQLSSPLSSPLVWGLFHREPFFLFLIWLFIYLL